MAVTLTVAALQTALRIEQTTDETAEATRLLAFATKVVEDHLGDAFSDAPEVIVNESVIRIAGYEYDRPNAFEGRAFADSLRNSGAAALLMPYRVLRAGSVRDATESSTQSAVGSVDNPITGLSTGGDGTLTVQFADGTTRTLDIVPAGVIKHGGN